MKTYGRAYAAAMRQPVTLLAGQLPAFLIIGVYVKVIQMRLTPSYGERWLDGGRVGVNCFHLLLFSSHEILLFTGLIFLVALWQRSGGDNPAARWTAWILALVVLPALSAIEVIDLAHYAFFLTPLGPEELHDIRWAPTIILSSNILRLPQVVLGLAIIVVLYQVLPCALWARARRGWERCRISHAGVLLVVGVIAAAWPKPPVADAMLTPHPLLWMLFGHRLPATWANTAVASGAPYGHPDTAARRRFAVTEPPTNVLVLILESTGATSLKTYNPQAPAGSQLARYADETVIFDHIYAPVPTTSHALFSILYGRYPYRGPFWEAKGTALAADSMAEHFARAGYRTQFTITSDLNYEHMRSYVQTGFAQVLDINAWPGQDVYTSLPWGRDDRLLTDQLKQFIAAPDQRPFFVVAMTSDPHHPYTVDHLLAPASASDAHGRYERLVDYDLDLVADMYAWMKQRGLAEQTLLLVVGDHGEAFGEHAGDVGHSAFLYEENVHIPCLLLHPQRLGLPKHIEQLGSQVDLRATITDILGMSDLSSGDGMSLLREDPERLITHFNTNGVPRFGIRDARYTYLYMPTANAGQLFDRSSDPAEAHNIAAREPGLATSYRTRLERWEAQHELALTRSHDTANPRP